ncbi:hypothetical protein BKK56_06215 [Rodentibacter genomosp. 2]|uniref:hypothetical protein n=1 Tax=Rodentibacter genomosp. 2 TaxID=1908266 RepID=UPI000986468B|nr:hypothetical protein BKK56_06215 [Rodentibacter genomosp. 2]
MSYYAFKDPQKKFSLSANEASRLSRDIAYYCPYCDTARLYICSRDGMKKPYFAANRANARHSEECFYSNSQNHISLEQYSESNFDFEGLCDSFLIPIKQVKKAKHNESKSNSSGTYSEKHIRTLRQLYLLCKSKSVQDTYNEQKIGYMLLDSRSLHMNPRGIFGNRVIETVLSKYFYNNEEKKLYFELKDNNKYKFIFEFFDETLYKNQRDTLYNNQDSIFVILGKWNKTTVFNQFISDFINQKQIWLLRK